MKFTSKFRNNIALPSIEEGVRLRSENARRNQAAAIACVAGTLSMAILFIHQRGEEISVQEGLRQADFAISSAQSLLTLRDPNRGYSTLSGRDFETTNEWGSLAKTGASPDQNSVFVEFSFSNKQQCSALSQASAGYFDLVFIDGKPAKSKTNPDGESQCSSMGQNSLRLVKNDPRERGLSLSAGMPDGRGGYIPSQAARPSSNKP